MTLTRYRTKGSQLTKEEADANFDHLEAADAAAAAALAASTGSSLVGHIASGSGEPRTAEAKMRGLAASIEDFGGGTGKTAAQNAAAIAAFKTEFAGEAAELQFETSGEYQLGDQIDWPMDFSMRGLGIPGSDVANQVPQMTRLKRVADVKMLNMVGAHRTTGRIGRNAFRNIGFSETANVSTESLIYAKYADSLVFEHSGYFGNSTVATSIGHIIDIEECWDWRMLNFLFKHAGLASASKYAMNIYNGANDSSNDFNLQWVRFQESFGDNINFDSSGGGNNNDRFWLNQCKFEDARGTIVTPTHIKGLARRVFVNQSTFSGCATRHVDMDSNATIWRFTDSQFARGKAGVGMAEYLLLAGTKARVAGCIFDTPPAALTQYINATAADAEITGNHRSSTTPPLVNESGAQVTRKVHHNPDYITEYGASATILSGQSSLVISHVQSYTPNLWDITVHFTGAPNGVDSLRISSISSTQFTVSSYLSGTLTAVGGDTGIAWSVERKRG